MTSVGVIADTHGLWRPEAETALAGVERILHAGDVGRPEILDALERIAETIAVRGNVDRESWAERLPLLARTEVEGIAIAVVHILDDLGFDPVAAGVRVVVHGHSHAPSIEEREGVLYLNPGSAGPRRFKLPVTVALLDIDEGRVRARIVPLPVADRLP